MPSARHLLGFAIGCLLANAAVSSAGAQPPQNVVLPPAVGVRDEALRRLFTPGALPAGTFTVYRSAEPIHTLVAQLRALDPAPAPGAWTVEPTGVFDAFGAEGPYDKARVARLFGGSLPSVARGSLDTAAGRLAIALISPHPDAALSSLQTGTMVIVTKLPVQRTGGQR